MNLKFTFLLFLLCTINFSRFAQDKNQAKFIDSYLNAAIWTIQGNHRPLVKWAEKVDTIQYKIVGTQKYMSEKALGKYLSSLEALTGKKFEHTNANDYQIIIFFGELKEYAALTGTSIPLGALGDFNNWSSRNWDKNYNLTKASYCIVPSKIQTLDHGSYHLKKAFLKSLGLLGETDDEFSILYKYPTQSNNGLSATDKRFVKLHYHQALTPGMDKATAKQTLLGLNNLEHLVKEKL